ncbi:MAG TPA: hypothetical protein VG826_05955 [Pirellulales bacterium]|nr:hypothetical protein [Pirellulales bacterium]
MRALAVLLACLGALGKNRPPADFVADLRGGPFAIVVLGVGHDLSRYAEKLGWEYVKVHVVGLPN